MHAIIREITNSDRLNNAMKIIEIFSFTRKLDMIDSVLVENPKCN